MNGGASEERTEIGYFVDKDGNRRLVYAGKKISMPPSLYLIAPDP